MFARFSTVAGERGAADAERDIRGCALKFYTEEGNCDMVGNNTPVFFLRDPLKFPDLNHAVKRDPRTYRHMHGFGSHTFSFINADQERFWVKFHFKSQQGIENLSNSEAEAMVGKDRESHQRDLYEAIERGDFPRWDFKVQIRSVAGPGVYHSRPAVLLRRALKQAPDRPIKT